MKKTNDWWSEIKIAVAWYNCMRNARLLFVGKNTSYIHVLVCDDHRMKNERTNKIVMSSDSSSYPNPFLFSGFIIKVTTSKACVVICVKQSMEL